jgi:fructokinase
MPGLIPRLREKLIERLNGYPGLPEHDSDDFIVPAQLGSGAGSAGSIALAEIALLRDRARH